MKSISRSGNSGQLIKYIFKEEKLTQTTYKKMVAELHLHENLNVPMYIAGIKLTPANIRQLIAESQDAAALKELRGFKGTIKEFIEHRVAPATYNHTKEEAMLARQAKTYQSGEAFADDILYHGTSGVMPNGFKRDGFDVLWTTQDAGIAQSHIWVSNSEWVVRKPYSHEADIRWKYPENRFEKELLNRMGYTFSDVVKNKSNKVVSWNSNKPLPTRKEVAEYVEKVLGYRVDEEGRYRIKGEGYDKIEPAGYTSPGILYVIPGAGNLNIYDGRALSFRMHDLSDSDYSFLRTLCGSGYDGIKVAETVKTDKEEIYDESIGLFPQAFNKLNPIPVQAHHMDPNKMHQLQNRAFDPEAFYDKAREIQTPFIIKHNLRGDSIEENIKEFADNEAQRIHTSSRQVAIHHTILSWGDKDAGKLTDTMLQDLANKYISLRGNNNLYLGTVHREKQHTHLHIAMSATRLDGISSRISKGVFQEIKVKLQEYQKEKYPELTNSVVKQHEKSNGKERNEHIAGKKYKNAERSSEMVSLLGLLETTYKKSTSRDHFISQLQTNGHVPYYRNGKLAGIKFEGEDGRKFRLNRLGFDEKKLNELNNMDKSLKELHDLRAGKNTRLSELQKAEIDQARIAEVAKEVPKEIPHAEPSPYYTIDTVASNESNALQLSSAEEAQLQEFWEWRYGSTTKEAERIETRDNEDNTSVAQDNGFYNTQESVDNNRATNEQERDGTEDLNFDSNANDDYEFEYER